MHRVRRRATTLIEEDARTFATVIRAYYQQDQAAIQRTLKRAIEVPLRVHALACRVTEAGRRHRNTVRQKYRVDLRCAMEFAEASRRVAKALVMTNIAWLGDAAYRRRITRCLQQS